MLWFPVRAINPLMRWKCDREISAVLLTAGRCDSDSSSALRCNRGNFNSHFRRSSETVVIIAYSPGWAAVLPDRPIGGVLSPFAALSSASSGFTSKQRISELINKSAGVGKRELCSSLTKTQSGATGGRSHTSFTQL
ncbi:hypothetical protein ILYODFUR_006441 [Ilyodon furcidens]|uniref:Uncharacterized protein n=1 Tax=Ilyodon furcidens TaxID=33524 RepID=A0ABV0V2W3_9TELE